MGTNPFHLPRYKTNYNYNYKIKSIGVIALYKQIEIIDLDREEPDFNNEFSARFHLLVLSFLHSFTVNRNWFDVLHSFRL